MATFGNANDNNEGISPLVLAQQLKRYADLGLDFSFNPKGLYALSELITILYTQHQKCNEISELLKLATSKGPVP